MEAEARRWEQEAAERKAFQDAQLELQSRQVKLMPDKDKADKESEKGRVTLLKKYGDVLRNTVVKLGNDVVEFIPFCDNIEKQFNDLKVPQELRVSLLKPFLNERARLLVNRLDAAHQDDYAYVKQYLLDQFRLVSYRNIFLNCSIRCVGNRTTRTNRLSRGCHCCSIIICRVERLAPSMD